MDSKRPDRRRFLKGGAALAGGLTLGSIEPAAAQEPAGGFVKGTPDLIAYRERSRFVNSVRIPHPPGGRHSPDEFGLKSPVAHFTANRSVVLSGRQGPLFTRTQSIGISM